MVSMKVTVMVVTLLTLCVLATNTHAALYTNCCRRYQLGKPRFSDIKGFSVQKKTELCSINAIIFHTKKGKKCADPALEWVLDYVSRIEYEAQKVHKNSQGRKK
ncbi:C-C motif chemokine 20-like [Poecilia reticulata]|uniref:C-C motif chemokine 20-like n=1 Tax=Poecilia reticulata TaxID=8081 RepID=A0A3P9PPV9_POERE|nr:PREDICTED: C-C motif chemokine 20-like [Poecilia reticulata]